MYMDTLCGCFTASYQCYRDCGKLPTDFETKCGRTCGADICSPPLHPYAESSAGAARLSGAAAGIAAAAALTLALSSAAAGGGGGDGRRRLHGGPSRHGDG